MDRPYLPRLVDPVLKELLSEHAAVWITGPRACGKTTTAARVARSVVRLDRAAEAVAFRADADAALAGLPEPVLIDEWQVVPEILGAVKRAVDREPRPGRFVVTGSARAALDSHVWPGTGRLVHVPMWGLTGAELAGRVDRPCFIDRLAAAGAQEAAGLEILSAGGPPPPDLVGYVDDVLRGGFPEPALHLPEAARFKWHDAYLEHVVARDAPLVDRARDPVRLRRYFEALALSTATAVEDKTLYDAAGISRTTAQAYDALLVQLGLVDPVPAWYTNRLKRLVRTARRHVAEPALAAAALRLDARGILREGEVLGRLLESWVLAQIRPTLPASSLRPRLFHLRTEQGRHEADLMVELGGGRVLGVEVKAAAAPQPGDARHLAWLREQLGDRLVASAVLHTGPRAFALGPRIWAVPMAWL